jgi:ABC-type molybdate transport system substrate-binding protein
MPAFEGKSHLSISRRLLLSSVPAAAVLGVAGPVRAATTDLAVSCDTTLGPAVRAAGAAFTARTGVRIDVFPTGPGLLLPQLRRQIQNDIIVTSLTTLDDANDDNLLGKGKRAGPWIDSLVIAGVSGAPTPSPDAPIAAADPSPASDIDGVAILAQLGLHTVPTLGAIDCDGVVFLLNSGAASAGLLHMTDVHANPGLTVLRAIPYNIASPLVFAASVTTLSWRPNPQAFVDYLATDEAMAVLANAGLETRS